MMDRAHRLACGAPAEGAELPPGRSLVIQPPLLFLSCNHGAKRRLRRMIIEELKGETVELAAGPGKDQDHQLLPFGLPTDAAVAKLVADWRLWGGARPAHSLHVASGLAADWTGAVAHAAELAGAVGAVAAGGSSLRLATHPKTLVGRLVADLPLEVQLDPKGFTHVLHVLQLPNGHFGVGLVPGSWYPPAQLEYKPGDGGRLAGLRPVSRAFYKMKEAAERWPELIFGGHPGSVGMAVDLGAAPGGWSQWLATAGQAKLVVAVDPGALDPAIPGALPNLVHIKSKIEAARAELDACVGSAGGGGVRLVVCDMNMHPEASARAVGSLADLLAPGAVLLLTLKMVKRGAAAGRALEQLAREALGRCGWEVCDVEQLFANGRHERTLIGRRRPCGHQGEQRLDDPRVDVRRLWRPKLQGSRNTWKLF